MKAVFFEVKEGEQKYLEERLHGWSLVFAEPRVGPLEVAKLHADAECLSVFIEPPLNAKTLDFYPNLKLVATRSTGFDHIDLAACRSRGVSVCNIPSYGENTVAEHTFALILMLARKVHQSYEQVRAGHVERAMLTGFDLQGKTLGVIGVGHIGMHAVRIGRGFGMHVLAYDVRHDPFLADLLDFRYVPLEMLLQESDIVSLHCPLLPDTHHLIGRDQFRLMKKGALLINTARGGLVDTDALVEALEAGNLGGAGLDVVEGEELIKEEHQLLNEHQSVERLHAAVRNRVLLGRDDVVFTPHNAFNSREAVQRILDTTIENLEAFRAGKPVNQVA